MNKQNFNDAVTELLELNAAKAGGMQAGVKRQAALVKALDAMAKLLGTTLKGPLQIDSRGDISIVCPESGRYGASFAKWLNQGSPRTGMYPGAIMEESSSWCHMNHFEVEKLVILFSESDDYRALK